MTVESLIGQIVAAEFDDPDYPDGITITVLLNEHATVGHWYVRLERIEQGRTLDAPEPKTHMLRVSWADDAVERALARLLDLRDNPNAHSLFGQEQALLVAIDALRASVQKGDGCE